MGYIARQKFPFRDVVLVADVISDTEAKSDTHLRRDLEKLTPTTLQEILNGLSALGLKCHHYSDPQLLVQNAQSHQDDVVLSVFGGEYSRNRMALVPAICEVARLSYIGPDAYGRVICQDKELSKYLAKTADLSVASHRILRYESDLVFTEDFPTPYVIKPLWEGSSIGIGPENLIRDRREGSLVARRLLNELKAPIMLEAFVPGKEVCYNVIQSTSHPLSAFSEMVIPDDAHYFVKNLFVAEQKLSSIGAHTHRLIDDELSAADRGRLNRLINLIGGMGYGRIDGKLEHGRFVFIEITPDAWLGKGGAFATAFRLKGLTYSETLSAILLSDRSAPLDPRANG